MKKIGLFSLVLFLYSTAGAQESNARFSLGLALSGPVAGVAASFRLHERYSVRIIYSSQELAQSQLLYYPDLNASKHYVFGIGRNSETTYVRGAIGKNWQKGAWLFNGEIGLNVPLNHKSSDDEGLYGVIDSFSYSILIGAGVHYQFK